MGINRKVFLFFLTDTATGNAWYVEDGQVKMGAQATAGKPLWLSQSPDGWNDILLSFARNAHYFGINRSFTIPLKFYNDGARIIRSLYYGTPLLPGSGRGIETPLSLIVLKWNDGTDIYETYYSGQLDMSKFADKVTEGVTVNVMEGGINQLIKAYEKTTFEIPCDGSIPENVKVHFSGMVADQQLYYNIPSFHATGSAFSPQENIVPLIKTGQTGDSFGTLLGEPTWEIAAADDPDNSDKVQKYFNSSSNYIVSFLQATKVHIKGTIIVRSDSFSNFYLYLTTSFVNYKDPKPNTRFIILVDKGSANVYTQYGIDTNTQSFFFDAVVNLAANEKLFLVMEGGNANRQDGYIDTSGLVQVSFTTIAPATQGWGIPAPDLFKLIIQNINQLSSTEYQQFNYGTVSALLEQYRHIICMSGDSVRASGDTSYIKFYNLKQIDTSNGEVISNSISYGPVLKANLSDFFDSFNPVLNAALGKTADDKVFFEDKVKVFDPSTDDLLLGEVTDLEIDPDEDLFFNELEIGYPEQQYDDNQGKYEWNTTARMSTPIKSLAKLFSLVSKWRADSFGLEKLRTGTSSNGTTANSSDNSVFLVNTDFTSFIYDYFQANYYATTNDPNDSNTTMTKLTRNRGGQELPTTFAEGGYFLRGNDTVFFMFNQSGASLNMTVALTIAGEINGQIGDTFRLRIVVNGGLLYEQTWTVTGVNTPIQITGPIPNHTFAQHHVLYVDMYTSNTCTAVLHSVDLKVGGTYFEAISVGDVTVQPAAVSALLPIPKIISTTKGPDGGPVTSQGFEYFRFNAQVLNPIFTLTFTINGWQRGAANQFTNFSFYFNTLIQDVRQFTGQPNQWNGRSGSITLTRTMVLNDVIFFLSDNSNTDFDIQGINFYATSQIKAYNLLRKTYDTVLGIPHPEAAYNIEDLSPRRMLRRHFNYLKSAVFNLIPGKLTFQTLSKNRYLDTTLGTDHVDEDADVDISTMGTPMMYPLVFTFKTEVPDTFAQLMNNAVNRHVRFNYNGFTLWGFPMEMSQKPSLNESQTWKLIASPKNNITDLIELATAKINELDMYQFFIPLLVGAKFYANVITKNPKYNFIDMDSDWFVRQLSGWINRKNYFEKVQSSDITPLQARTKGLAPVTVFIKNCKGQTVDSYELGVVMTTAISTQEQYWEGFINWSLYPPDQYYVYMTAGSSFNISTGISEGFWLKETWPKTLLFEYYHRTNKQSTIFSTGWKGSFRIEGNIIDMMPQADFASFVDEPEDIDTINGRRYRSFTLALGYDDGLPDWTVDLVNAIMLLSNVTIDGVQYARDGGAKWEVTKFPGTKKKFWALAIRPSKVHDGSTFGLDNGDPVNDIAVSATLNVEAFGNNTGVDNLVDVEFTEE